MRSLGQILVENEPDGPGCGTYLCADWAGMPGRRDGATYVDATPSGTLYLLLYMLHSSHRRPEFPKWKITPREPKPIRRLFFSVLFLLLGAVSPAETRPPKPRV